MKLFGKEGERNESLCGSQNEEIFKERLNEFLEFA